MEFKPGRFAHNMYEYTLSNGLHLLLVPRSGLDVVTANVTYHVGSRNEGLGVSGATHFLEHLQFKGSKKFHGKDGMWKLEEEGAYMNATTYTDRTNFFEVIETKHLKDVIDREADRMLEPLLTEESLKSEMSVVRNEFERGENNDFQILHKQIMATAFQAHPYHHSTIGWKDDIENVSAKALREFHDTFYIPNNATYTFVGNFNPQEVKEMVAEAFSEVPSGVEPPTMYTSEGEQSGQRRVVVQRPSHTSLLGIAFKAVNGLHRDAIVLEVLAKLMGPGPKSPFEKLKHQRVIHDAMPSWERMKDPYVFSLWVTTNDAGVTTIENAEKHVMQLLQQYPRPDESDLKLAKRSLEFKWKEAMESTRGMASEINEAISRGDPYDVFNRFDVLKSVTSDDILRVASEIFVKHRSTVGWFMPGNNAKLENSVSKYDVGIYPSAPSIESIPLPATNTINFADVSDTTKTSAYTKYNSAKTHIRLSIQSNASTYNAFELMARQLLSQMMTKGVCIRQTEFNEENIHSFLNQNGIERIVRPAPYGIDLVASIPSTDPKVVNQMVSLMKSEIKSPSLSVENFHYLQRKLGAELAGSSGNVNKEAAILLSQQLFKDGGCNFNHSSKTLTDALWDLSHDSIKEEHAKLMKHGVIKMSVLSPSDEVMTSFKKIKTDNYEPMNYHVLKNNPGVAGTKDLHLEGKTSCTVKWAHVIENPSMATKLAIGILGNGFSGRLMKIVRDKDGLTYGIYAKQNRLYGAHTFEVTATFAPSLLQRGLSETARVMKEWKEGITNEEIDIQKQILLGSQSVHWDNPAAISATIHSTLLQDKPLEVIDQFKQKIKDVTYEQVRDALNNQLHVDRLKRVIVGTFE